MTEPVSPDPLDPVYLDGAPYWRAPAVLAMTRASYRQLDYWRRTGRLGGRPEWRSPGSGYRVLYDVHAARRVAILAAASARLDVVKPTAVADELADPVPGSGELRIRLTPAVVLLVDLDRVLHERLRDPPQNLLRADKEDARMQP